MEQVGGFDWDDGNRDKCQKHGVSLAEIEEVFRSDPLVLPDRTGSSEARFNAVGLTGEGRHVFVVYTLRDTRSPQLLRPISARYMHRKEIDAYERSR